MGDWGARVGRVGTLVEAIEADEGSSTATTAAGTAWGQSSTQRNVKWLDTVEQTVEQGPSPLSRHRGTRPILRACSTSPKRLSESGQVARAKPGSLAPVRGSQNRSLGGSGLPQQDSFQIRTTPPPQSSAAVATHTLHAARAAPHPQQQRSYHGDVTQASARFSRPEAAGAGDTAPAWWQRSMRVDGVGLHGFDGPPTDLESPNLDVPTLGENRQARDSHAAGHARPLEGVAPFAPPGSLASAQSAQSMQSGPSSPSSHARWQDSLASLLHNFQNRSPGVVPDASAAYVGSSKNPTDLKDVSKERPALSPLLDASGRAFRDSEHSAGGGFRARSESPLATRGDRWQASARGTPESPPANDHFQKSGRGHFQESGRFGFSSSVSPTRASPFAVRRGLSAQELYNPESARGPFEASAHGLFEPRKSRTELLTSGEKPHVASALLQTTRHARSASSLLPPSLTPLLSPLSPPPPPLALLLPSRLVHLESGPRSAVHSQPSLTPRAPPPLTRSLTPQSLSCPPPRDNPSAAIGSFSFF
ncbi:hypothetical protein T484DRAFT_1936803 [Baffinella frigidus]|nr:hypothetical protein T484DRAFT_1936803 [Cryptophyta sp. CCMP2293]